MPVILDACAIIAYLRDEDGGDIVESALISEECFIHAINICEVYKDCLSRGENKHEADQIIEDLYSIGLVVCEDMDTALWKEAASLKATIRRISYADCLALSMTARLNGTLFSSDHHEFDIIADKGFYSIRFIR
ncbi:MAG: PIN domain-containing protein [Desulfamplus sp.]|nr:PIN domain-containing protein [Desulfamplus sp.]